MFYEQYFYETIKSLKSVQQQKVMFGSAVISKGKEYHYYLKNQR